MNHFIKYLGLGLVLIGIATVLIDRSEGAEMPLLAGLFILFVTKEKRHDERVISVKSTSAYLALILGYAVKLLSSNLYSHQLLPFELVEINHFLILVFALAIVLYYLRIGLFLK